MSSRDSYCFQQRVKFIYFNCMGSCAPIKMCYIHTQYNSSYLTFFQIPYLGSQLAQLCQKTFPSLCFLSLSLCWEDEQGTLWSVELIRLPRPQKIRIRPTTPLSIAGDIEKMEPLSKLWFYSHSILWTTLTHICPMLVNALNKICPPIM